MKKKRKFNKEEIEKFIELDNSIDPETNAIADALFDMRVTDKEIKKMKELFRSNDEKNITLARSLYEYNTYYSLNPVLNFMYRYIDKPVRAYRKMLLDNDESILNELTYKGEIVVFENKQK